MITVHLKSNGEYWQAWWMGANGKRQYKGIGPKAKLSKTVALRRCRELQNELALEPAMLAGDEVPTLKAWTERFKALKEGDYSDTTMKLYEATIKSLIEHFGEDRQLNTIKPADASDWRLELARRGISESTIRKEIRNAKVIFALALDEERIGKNPFAKQVSAPPTLEKDWHYVSLEDFETLLKACPHDGWRAMFGLCRLAGLRWNEAQRLTWRDIDFEKRIITIRPKNQKQTTKQRKRTVPIQPRLMDILTARFASCEPGETVTGCGTNNRQRDPLVIVRRAKLEPWDRLFHTLRKNCETDWLALYPVMDVCDWMGHAPAVASKHYHQTAESVIKQVTGHTKADQLDQLRAENQRLRQRIRRLIQLAREARHA